MRLGEIRIPGHAYCSSSGEARDESLVVDAINAIFSSIARPRDVISTEILARDYLDLLRVRQLAHERRGFVICVRCDTEINLKVLVSSIESFEHMVER